MMEGDRIYCRGARLAPKGDRIYLSSPVGCVIAVLFVPQLIRNSYLPVRTVARVRGGALRDLALRTLQYFSFRPLTLCNTNFI